jgi:hypothetical protein
MSVAWVGAGIAAVGVVSSASSARAATGAAADANSAALASQEKQAAERLAFDKEQYADGAEDRKFASENAREIAGWQKEDRTKYNNLQDEQVARGRVYQGEEDKMLEASKTYDNEGRRESEVKKAQADVNAGFTASNEQLKRDQGRRGINLSGAAAAEMDRKNRLAQSLGLASAATTATKNVETQGYARKMDALGLGKGLIGNQATQAGLQLGAGNASVGNAQVPIGIRQSAGTLMSQGYGNAGAAYSSLANNQMNSFMSANNYGASVGSGVGQAFGSILNRPGITSGISSAMNKLFMPQAGSFSNGSVQGNSDYEFDI